MKKLVIIIIMICFISFFVSSLVHAKTTGNFTHLHHTDCNVTKAADTLNNMIDTGIPIKMNINHNGNLYHIRYSIGTEQIQFENLPAFIPSILTDEQPLELSVYYSPPDRFLNLSPFSAFFLNPNITLLNYTAQMYFSYDDPLSFSATGELLIIASPEYMEFHITTIRAKGIEVKYHQLQNALHSLCFGISPFEEG